MHRHVALAIAVSFSIACTPRPRDAAPTATNASYDSLVALFDDWRAFQRPPRAHGVPDYSSAAMARQHADLEGMRQRHARIDPTAWDVTSRVDYELVRAEMNGLDFDHRVLAPWARNPAFYVTVFPDQSDQPAREGPHADGAIELWRYPIPLDEPAVAAIGAGLDLIPPLLAAARANLVGNARDLWLYGTRTMATQRDDLEALARRVAETTPLLLPKIEAARLATDSLVLWLESEAAGKEGPSGIGIENYDWYLRNVLLLPYDWRDEVTLMERELDRAHAYLRLEEERNRGLPEQRPISSPAEHELRFSEGVTWYLAFLREHDLLTIEPYSDRALRERVGSYRAGPREFFTEVDYRDPVVMRTHGYHWFDLARMESQPHESPIRRGPLLYNIFDTRTEGLATGWEEMMLGAGMFDQRPRSRELIYVLLAQRAARALGDLRMHANQWTLEEAARFASANTPRGWLRLEGGTVWFEQHLYLQQPGYGTSYVIGKLEIERIIRVRARQLGEAFSLRRVMAEIDAAGLIPVSMVGWEVTGERPDLDDSSRSTEPRQ